MKLAQLGQGDCVASSAADLKRAAAAALVSSRCNAGRRHQFAVKVPSSCEQVASKLTGDANELRAVANPLEGLPSWNSRHASQQSATWMKVAAPP